MASTPYPSTPMDAIPLHVSKPDMRRQRHLPEPRILVMEITRVQLPPSASAGSISASASNSCGGGVQFTHTFKEYTRTEILAIARAQVSASGLAARKKQVSGTASHSLLGFRDLHAVDWTGTAGDAGVSGIGRQALTPRKGCIVVGLARQRALITQDRALFFPEPGADEGLAHIMNLIQAGVGIDSNAAGSSGGGNGGGGAAGDAVVIGGPGSADDTGRLRPDPSIGTGLDGYGASPSPSPGPYGGISGGIGANNTAGGAGTASALSGPPFEYQVLAALLKAVDEELHQQLRSQQSLVNRILERGSHGAATDAQSEKVRDAEEQVAEYVAHAEGVLGQVTDILEEEEDVESMVLSTSRQITALRYPAAANGDRDQQQSQQQQHDGHDNEDGSGGGAVGGEGRVGGAGTRGTDAGGGGLGLDDSYIDSGIQRVDTASVATTPAHTPTQSARASLVQQQPYHQQLLQKGLAGIGNGYNNSAAAPSVAMPRSPPLGPALGAAGGGLGSSSRHLATGNANNSNASGVIAAAAVLARALSMGGMTNLNNMNGGLNGAAGTGRNSRQRGGIGGGSFSGLLNIPLSALQEEPTTAQQLQSASKRSAAISTRKDSSVSGVSADGDDDGTGTGDGSGAPAGPRNDNSGSSGEDLTGGHHQADNIGDAVDAVDAQTTNAIVGNMLLEAITQSAVAQAIQQSQQAAAAQQPVAEQIENPTWREEVIAMEELLEWFAAEVEHRLGQARLLQSQLSSERKRMTIVLAHSRNKLLMMQIAIQTATMGMGLCTMISGYFGMNLDNGTCGPEGCRDHVSLGYPVFLLITTVATAVSIIVAVFTYRQALRIANSSGSNRGKGRGRNNSF